MIQRSQDGHTRGFTLIELLVVIAIIGVLAGITIPVLISTRETARRTQCQNNMRQIGTAWFMHVSKKNGRFPTTMHTLNSGEERFSWILQLEPYLENIDTMRICPSDPNRQARMNGQLVEDPDFKVTDPTTGELVAARFPKVSTSYAYNAYLTKGFDLDPFGRPVHNSDFVSRLSDLKSAAHTFLAFESNLGPTLYGDHTHSNTWFGNNTYPRNWRNVTREIDPARHSGTSNYLYADGHVEVIRAEVLEERSRKGENFAKPGNG